MLACRNAQCEKSVIVRLALCGCGPSRAVPDSRKPKGELALAAPGQPGNGVRKCRRERRDARLAHPGGGRFAGHNAHNDDFRRVLHARQRHVMEIAL
jgi:hypothetical protein